MGRLTYDDLDPTDQGDRYLIEIIKVLECAFPKGVPKEEYAPLVELLRFLVTLSELERIVNELLEVDYWSPNTPINRDVTKQEMQDLITQLKLCGLFEVTGKLPYAKHPLYMKSSYHQLRPQAQAFYNILECLFPDGAMFFPSPELKALVAAAERTLPEEKVIGYLAACFDNHPVFISACLDAVEVADSEIDEMASRLRNCGFEEAAL